MTMGRLLCIGEFLWDVFDDRRCIGGAAFNVAAHASRLGLPTRFLSAVGDDEDGREARKAARRLGLDGPFLKTTNQVPTGTVRVFLSDGQPDFTIRRPAAYDRPVLEQADWEALRASPPDWVYFGTLAQQSEQARELTRAVLAAFPAARRFYDVNLRKDSYSPALLRELLDNATTLKLNEDELPVVGESAGVACIGDAAGCAVLANACSLDVVCLTRGERGCLLWRNGECAEVPGEPVQVVDAVGAGDAFSAALMSKLDEPGATLADIATFANHRGGQVAARAGAVPADL